MLADVKKEYDEINQFRIFFKNEKKIIRDIKKLNKNKKINNSILPIEMKFDEQVSRGKILKFGQDKYDFDLRNTNICRNDDSEDMEWYKKRIMASIFYSDVIEDYIIGYDEKKMEPFLKYFFQFMKQFYNNVVWFNIEYSENTLITQDEMNILNWKLIKEKLRDKKLTMDQKEK